MTISCASTSRVYTLQQHLPSDWRSAVGIERVSEPLSGREEGRSNAYSDVRKDSGR